ncbi:MAG: hypothetical protein EXS13_11525 [Planctomycetes bacterium]|nr:hypothetical protein [Planctomycetota bacterium]
MPAAAIWSLASLAFAALWRGGFVPGLGVGAALACVAVARWCELAPAPASAITGRDSRWLAWLLTIAAGWCALALLPLPIDWRAWLAPGATALDTALGRAVISGSVGSLALDPTATRGALLALALAAPVIAAARAVGRQEAGRRAFVLAIGAAACGVALLGCVETFLGRPLIHDDLPPHARPFGPFANRNHAGALLVMALPLVLAAAREGARAGRRAATRVAAAAAALLTLGLLLNGSRGALLSALGVGAFLLLSARLTLRSKLLLGAALAVVLVVPSHAFDRRGDTTTVAERATLAGDALQMAADSPLLGIGLGGFGAAYPPYQTVARDLRFRHAECEPLELLVEGGVPLLLLAATAALLLARVAWRVARRPTATASSRAIAAAALAVPFHALCDFPLRIPGVALPFLLLVGALFACDEDAE